MAIVTETRSSGLVVARDSMDEAAVEKQLKLIDSRLTLQKHWDESCGWVYKVICFVSDTYAPVVLTWKDEHGHPLPLSSALSDKMQSLMLGARNAPEDADTWNARVLERQERDRRELAHAVIEDHRPYVERGRVSVSMTDAKKKSYATRSPDSRPAPKPKSGMV